MKYLATGPWMRVDENSARRAVLYVSKPGEYVVHTQYFENGGVNYTHGDYTRTLYVGVTGWQRRVADLLHTGDPAPVELAEAAELAALANRLVA